MNLIDLVRNAGVVGAGGGGFPAHVKLASKANTIIANGAECEPLLHKDAVVMEEQSAAVVQGIELSMDATGATDGVVAVKAKNTHAVNAMQQACKGSRVRVHLLGDYYPAGDEYDLVHSVTGRLIPAGGIPTQVGTIVNNVETLANISRAAAKQPVTHKTLTIAGAVHNPISLTVPIGTPFRHAIQLAGGPTTTEPVLCIGGLMMGQTTTNLDTPITKTSTGVVVLPKSHHVIQRKIKPPTAQAAIGKSACDQCRYCTEFCPRYLLGYAVEPHQVMRSLAFTATGQDAWNTFAALCCSCGLCTLYACPEELFPKEACDNAKTSLRQQNFKWSGPSPSHPHPMHDGRRVPIKSLVRKLDVQPYDLPAPYSNQPVHPPQLVIPLKQHAGSPCQPTVTIGQQVQAGQPIGSPPKDTLGTPIHAPLQGTITDINPNTITLQTTP